MRCYRRRSGNPNLEITTRMKYAGILGSVMPNDGISRFARPNLKKISRTGRDFKIWYEFGKIAPLETTDCGDLLGERKIK